MNKEALRSHVLNVVATLCSLSALAALLDPDRVATALGIFLVGVNGYSQFYAVYVGSRLAQAGLAAYAAQKPGQPLFGDITAVFLLAQPLGRMAAAFTIGLPQGALLAVSALELGTGALLMALRR